jgi:hypothetical protein
MEGNLQPCLVDEVQLNLHILGKITTYFPMYFLHLGETGSKLKLIAHLGKSI